MPTLQNVLDAFDSFAAEVVQPMALTRALEKMGFDIDAVPTAINDALSSGHLVKTQSGGIRKPGINDLGYSVSHMEILKRVAPAGDKFPGLVTSLPAAGSDNDPPEHPISGIEAKVLPRLVQLSIPQESGKDGAYGSRKYGQLLKGLMRSDPDARMKCEILEPRKAKRARRAASGFRSSARSRSATMRGRKSALMAVFGLKFGTWRVRIFASPALTSN